MSTNNHSTRSWLSADRLLAMVCTLAAAFAILPRAHAQGEGNKDAPPAASTQLSTAANSSATPKKFLPPGAFFPDEGVGHVVYPKQKITIRFNHKKHVQEFGSACTDCHAEATKSVKVDDRLLPSPKVCDQCHSSNHDDLNKVTGGEGMAACSFCHIGYKSTDGNTVDRMVWPVAHLKSNHRTHAERNINCEQCHGAVQELVNVTDEQLPRMKGCFGCHALPGPSAGTAKSTCETCHVTLPDGRIRSEFAEGKMLPPRWQSNLEHTADFMDRHKRVAADNSQACGSCHREDFCTDCHDGRVRPRNIHPNDYLSLHPIEARLDNPRCSTCHQQQQFCQTCHQRAGITMTGSPGNVKGQGRFHPPPSIWSELPRTQQHHAWEAQRNINACVACHTERDCATCHATFGAGGRGFNPHPPNFRSKCGSAASKNLRPCLVCHDPGDANLSACR